MTRWYIPLLVGTVLALATHSHAAIQVTLGDLELQPGETGLVDVLIRSTDGSDVLDMFGVEFLITTSGSTRLEFVDPQSDSQLTDPEYILAGDSLNAIFAVPAGSVLTLAEQNDWYIGGDGTLTGFGVAVPTTDSLLTRLKVTAATSNAPILGDAFTISLQPGPSTFFYDPLFTPLDATSVSGNVTIGAVPEPTSFLVWSLLGLTCLGVTYRQRRKRAI